MRWEPEVSRGSWIDPRLDRAWGSMHVVVPRGFEAYARVFHPVAKRRPVGLSWAELESRHARGILELVEIESPRVPWRLAAGEFGLVWHPLFQWQRILATDPLEGSRNGVPAPDGWRYEVPAQGRLPAGMLARLAGVLARHTATPTEGCAAVWEGWGGLLSDDGVGYVALTAEPETDASGRGAPTEYARRAPLPPEVGAGPRLSLPMREYVLFDAGIVEFEASDWGARAPWVRGPDLPAPQSPNLLWPEDRAWVLVSEIDFDSTIIGGSAALIDELCARGTGLPVGAPDGALEVEAVAEGADLSSVGDRRNP